MEPNTEQTLGGLILNSSQVNVKVEAAKDEVPLSDTPTPSTPQPGRRFIPAPDPNDPKEIYKWINALNEKGQSSRRDSESSSREPSSSRDSSGSRHHSRHDYSSSYSRHSRYSDSPSTSNQYSRQESSRYRNESRRHSRDRDHSSRHHPSGSKRKRSPSPYNSSSRGRHSTDPRNSRHSHRPRYSPNRGSGGSRSKDYDRGKRRPTTDSSTSRERDFGKRSAKESTELPLKSESKNEEGLVLPNDKIKPDPELDDIHSETDSKTTNDYMDDIDDEDLDDAVEKWVRSSPAELYYERSPNDEMIATKRTRNICEKFNKQILERAKAGRLKAEEEGKLELEKMNLKETIADKKEANDDSDSYSDDSDDDCKESRKSHAANQELEKRKKHPKRLHNELWHNEPGLMNDGPVCRCSAKAKRYGIRHGFFPGETPIPKCDPFSNNAKTLYHYRINISPEKNFLVNAPTKITHDHHDFLFEGFSIFSHCQLDAKIPPCRVIRFNIRYFVYTEAEKFPDSFCVQELLHFESYILSEILELVDLKYDRGSDACSEFHIMPRFVRPLPDNGKELLSMNVVLKYLLDNDKEVIRKENLTNYFNISQEKWQIYADGYKGKIVTKWGMKPSAIRVDQIDRNVDSSEIEQRKSGKPQKSTHLPFPLIIHFGVRPPQLSYAGNAEYQRAWRRYVKYRHLLSNMSKPSSEDKNKLGTKELQLQQMRTASSMKRDVTIAVSSHGFRSTGLCCDIIQHAMLIPVLIGHLRFHKSLTKLEATMGYTFKNRNLLQLAMTHPSYRENFGTNPDHARNALTNCGIRQPEYGDRRIHYAATRKRGINTLINIMARFGAEVETESEITHNERLEFLGDAVVEFVTSIHLFHMFPDLEEGGLATYRAAIVQNQHLAVLAQGMELEQFMLYAHGSDLCHDSELRHAMANCFEALMGAIFIDGGIEVADSILAKALFGSEPELFHIWKNYKIHPLQREEPNGDRHWIQSYPVLQKLVEFEDMIGIEFKHIRLLARAFTDRSLGYNNLTKGSNQRLEFLGDTVLQLISSEYLYRHFPDHHEGHLSLLRSSLVNNRTQSLVCDDLGMGNFAMRSDPKAEMKTKDRADLLEAFLGALYIDKGLIYCARFCSVCFIPRLSQSIIKQEWNDPKSKLQQCCLTLRAMNGKEPDIPVYKVVSSKGPTNSRLYTLIVTFRGERLGKARGHSIQEGEMNAAEKALRDSKELFPQLHHQQRVMDKTRVFSE